jgi:type IV pilus assembly protein PilA
VTEGLNLMSDMKAGVAEWYAQEGEWPSALAQIGISGAATDKAGKYVSQIDIDVGTLVATFGKQANGNINGETLSLKPLVSPNNDVIWVCGLREAPSGASEADTASGAVATTLLAKYLPANCRSST